MIGRSTRLRLAWVWWRIARRAAHPARQDALRGQLFHVYLMAYGAFRFAHEFMRDTPRWMGPWSGYHVLALAVAALGALSFARRANLRSVGEQNSATCDAGR